MKKYVDLGYSPCVNTRTASLNIPREIIIDDVEEDDNNEEDEIEEPDEVAGYSHLRDASVREYLNYLGFLNAGTISGITNWRTIRVDDISS